MRPTAVVTLRVYTNRFLGTPAKGQQLLNVLETVDDGRWVPEKWNTVEPIRYPFEPGSKDRLVRSWVQARPPGSYRVTNTLLFRRSRQPRLVLQAEAWRSVRPHLNNVWAHLDA